MRQDSILEGINRILREAISSETEARLGRVCLAVAEQITASKFGFVGELNRDTGLLDLLAISDPGWAACRIPSPRGKHKAPSGFENRGLFGRVLSSEAGFYTNEPTTHVDRVGTPEGHTPLHRFMSIPVIEDGKVRVIFGVGNKKTDYDDTDVQHLGLVANELHKIIKQLTADAEIRKLTAELEQRVLDRTAQLAAVNKELEAFSYSVSHDLRAPLRAIEGFSQALVEDYESRLDAQGVDFLHRVSSESQRMAQLIDDLLKLSRITRVELRTEQVGLSELALETVERLRAAEPDRRVSVEVAAGISRRGDPGLLKQVLENLLSNAWKFSGRADHAEIEFGLDDQDGEEVLYVRDNGVGFDMKYANKLFAPFQRLHAMTEFPGSGIGLSTVQRIVARHGGRVWCDSEPGKGTTFFFTLGHLDQSGKDQS